MDLVYILEQNPNQDDITYISEIKHGADSNHTQYFPMFDKGYYNFSWNGIQFFALNTWDTKGDQSSSELDLNSNQIKWFNAEMQKEEIKKAPEAAAQVEQKIIFLLFPYLVFLKQLQDPMFFWSWQKREEALW